MSCIPFTKERKQQVTQLLMNTISCEDNSTLLAEISYGIHNSLMKTTLHCSTNPTNAEDASAVIQTSLIRETVVDHFRSCWWCLMQAMTLELKESYVLV